MYLSSAVLTDVGRKRDHNEDFVTYFEPSDEKELSTSGSLFIVADGVGGASQGEKASRYAAQTVLYEYYNQPEKTPQDRLRELIQRAGNQINSYAEEGEHFMRMATTMVAAVILNDSLIIANVGDSRAYLVRDNIANQISRDHSFVGEMVRDGLMTEEEARVSKKKNRITRSLGGERDVRVDVFDGIALAEGDKILLCSDGFSQYATKDTIVELTQSGTADEIAAHMVAHANAHGGSDNISVILIKVSASPLDETLSMSARETGRPALPPNWDDAKDTDPSEEKPSDIVAKFNDLDIKIKVALIASLPILLGCVIMVFVFIFGGDDEPIPPIPPLHTLPAQNTNTPFVSPDVTITPTSLPSPTATLNVAGTAVSSSLCQFEIRPKDKQFYADMADLLSKRFSIKNSGYDNFMSDIAPHISCAKTDESCAYAKDYNFKIGWTIDISMEKLGMSIENCENGEGEVIFPQQQ